MRLAPASARRRFLAVRILSRIVVATLLAGSLAGAHATHAPAQTDAAAASPVARVAEAVPADVLSRLHHADLLEAEEARLALKSAHDPQVHAFAKVLIADHVACERMLDEYARAHDLVISDASADATGDAEFITHLRTLSGADFDRVFTRHIYESHVKQIDDLLETRAHLEDQKLRNVLTRIKPKLDQHKNSARSILRRLEAQQAER